LAKPNQEDIETFLLKCKNAVRKSFYLTKTSKNKATILELGFTKEDVKREIESLSVEHYSEGPLPSHAFAEEIWVFGKRINCREIYIKISISKYNDPGELIETLYCISFHFADHPLHYPNQK